MILTPTSIWVRWTDEPRRETGIDLIPPDELYPTDEVVECPEGHDPYGHGTCRSCGGPGMPYRIGPEASPHRHSYRVVTDTRCYCVPCAAAMRLRPSEYWVEVREHDRALGGPEEGGWWYDTSLRIVSVPVSGLRLAIELASDLADRYDNEGRHPIDSVCCEGVYSVTIGPVQGPEHTPDHRPHYE